MRAIGYFLVFCLTIPMAWAQPCGIDFNLNGTNDYITIPNTDAINLQNTRNRTIEFWFNATDITTRQVIYEEGAQVNAIYFYLENGRIHSGAFRSNANNASNRRLFRSAAGAIATDTWYHIALVLSDDGTNFDFLWYLDGVLQDQQSGLQVNSHSGNNSIGRNGGNLRFPSGTTWSASSVGGSTSETYNGAFTGNDSNNYNFSGDLSLFRIWNVPRTQTEIDTNKELLLETGTSLVAYMDTGSVVYAPNGSTVLSASVSGNGNSASYTWIGTTNTNWNTGSNWAGGSAPLSNKLEIVTINASSNYPEISSEIRMGELIVDTGVQLEISLGGTLNVYYNMQHNGEITVNDGGAFVYNNCKAIAGSGTFIIHRDSPDYPREDFYSIWSTPTFSADSKLGQIFADPIRAFTWDASLDPGAYVERNREYNMVPGEGIFVRPNDVSGMQTRTFSGRVNNGLINSPIYYNSATDNFNLIGNPYPSAIDWFKVYDDNSDVMGGTIYYWDQTITGASNEESDYITFNSTGSNPPGATEFIATAQGVFSESLQAGTITFKNTHRVVANNGQFFRSNNSSANLNGRMWLKLSKVDKASTLLLGLLEEATNGYDQKYDGKFLDEGYEVQFYSLLEDLELAIQAISELNGENISIPLGFKVATGGNYTIGIDQQYLNAETDIILEDKELGIYVDLKQGDYAFSTSALENNNRFALNFQDNRVLSVEDETLEGEGIKVLAHLKENTLFIETNLERVEIVELYDITGKRVFKSVFEGPRYFTPSLSRGVYILNLKLENGESISRKLIK